MEITNDLYNSLLKRREIIAVLEMAGNPGMENVVKAVSEKFKTNPEAIAIKSLKSKFGSQYFEIEAFLYDSTEHKARVEPKPKVKAAGAK